MRSGRPRGSLDHAGSLAAPACEANAANHGASAHRAGRRACQGSDVAEPAPAGINHETFPLDSGNAYS